MNNGAVLNQASCYMEENSSNLTNDPPTDHSIRSIPNQDNLLIDEVGRFTENNLSGAGYLD